MSSPPKPNTTPRTPRACSEAKATRKPAEGAV
jgi:hypothetical protein